MKPEPIHTRTDPTQKQMARTQTNPNPSLTRADSNSIQFKLKVVSDDISYTASLNI